MAVPATHMASDNAFSNPKTSRFNQKHHPYTENLIKETSGDSTKAFLHWGDVLDDCKDGVYDLPAVQLKQYNRREQSDAKCSCTSRLLTDSIRQHYVMICGVDDNTHSSAHSQACMLGCTREGVLRPSIYSWSCGGLATSFTLAS